MTRWRFGIVCGALLVGVAGLALAGPARLGLAQDGTPAAVVDPVDVAHPAFVYAGGCDTRGDTIAPLSELTVTQGALTGAAGAIETSRSFTTVPLAFDALLADSYTLNVHLSAEALDTTLACGDIGGVPDVNGALTIGLGEQADSGRTGIAYLAPGADPATTDILIFMTEEDVTVGAGADAGAGTPGAVPIAFTESPTPTPSTAATVEVALTEWAITVPATVAAGPVIFRVVNDGTVPHTVLISGGTVQAALPAPIGPGETADLEVNLAPGTYEIICTLGEGAHRDAGMQATITVE